MSKPLNPLATGQLPSVIIQSSFGYRCRRTPRISDTWLLNFSSRPAAPHVLSDVPANSLLLRYILAHQSSFHLPNLPLHHLAPTSTMLNCGEAKKHQERFYELSPPPSSFLHHPPPRSLDSRLKISSTATAANDGLSNHGGMLPETVEGMHIHNKIPQHLIFLSSTTGDGLPAESLDI